jgi:NADH dehydrogenase (ubiquinone) 1 beta subcomplex subunit 8
MICIFCLAACDLKVHEEDDGLNMWTPDPPPVEPSTALRQFSIAALGIAAFGYVIYANVPERPSIPREYPYSGLVRELGGLEENKVRYSRLTLP